MPFFIDCHPNYQPGLDFKRVKSLGYAAAICKVSEGTSYVPNGLKAYVERIKAAGLIVGYYHFLTDASGDWQAEHFAEVVRSLGGPAGRLLVADFESYGSRSPTNAALKGFVRGVKQRTNNHALICYSGWGYWTGGTPTGDAADYGIDATWDARYADMARHDYPRLYWRTIKGWYEKQPKWGGVDPVACQFTSAGRVDGTHMDVNKAFVSKEDLLKLTTRSAR